MLWLRRRHDSEFKARLGRPEPCRTISIGKCAEASKTAKGRVKQRSKSSAAWSAENADEITLYVVLWKRLRGLRPRLSTVKEAQSAKLQTCSDGTYLFIEPQWDPTQGVGPQLPLQGAPHETEIYGIFPHFRCSFKTKSSELTYSSQQLGCSSGKAERLIA